MDFAAELVEQNRAFGDLIVAGDLSAPVSTCPGWSLNQLFRHVGRGHRWAAQIVLDRPGQAVDPRTVPDGKPPEGLAAGIDWLHAGSRKLLDAVTAAGEDTPVWTFTGTRPARWWIRRRLHETVVHRADAAIAVGHRFDVGAELAADTISEWLDLATGRRGVSPDTIHLHATDTGLEASGEWAIADGAWSHAHSKADVALRGPAKEILLALTGRRAVGETSVELLGDDVVWQAWLEATRF
jgi:uncharacterized protein (TIGR03083 family)